MAGSSLGYTASEGERRRSGLSPAKGESLFVRAWALWVIAVLLAAQASALPINIGFALLHGDEKPVTEGCETKTCCTALCYVDKHGTHHCVHQTEDSSQCGVSKNELKNNPLLPLSSVVLQNELSAIPDFIPTRWLPRARLPVQTCDLSIPSPPPK